MPPTRRIAVVSGAFFLATEFTAIGALLLYHPVLHGHDYIVSSGADSRVFLGAFLEVLLAFANIGTAVTLFPVVRRQNESIALGYVCGRLLEAAIIVVGIVSVLSVVTLRQDIGGTSAANTASLHTTARSLVAIHDWTFLLGPNVILGANTLMLAYLMYRSRLVPRAIAILGLVGGPIIFVSAVAVLFGAYGQISTIGVLAGIPVLAWEVSLGIWLIVKGFKASSPILSEDGHLGGLGNVPAIAPGTAR